MLRLTPENIQTARLDQAVQVVAVKPGPIAGYEVKVIDLEDLPVGDVSVWVYLMHELSGSMLIPLSVPTTLEVAAEAVAQSTLSELPGVLCTLHNEENAAYLEGGSR